MISPEQPIRIGSFLGSLEVLQGRTVLTERFYIWDLDVLPVDARLPFQVFKPFITVQPFGNDTFIEFT